MSILTELRDPRVKLVTVTSVEVAPDMKSAKVNVSIMGDEAQQRLTLNTLQNAAGFLQHRIADRIETRYTPRLQFQMDKGVKNSLEVARILAEVLPKQQAPPADQPAGSQEPPDDQGESSPDAADDRS